ncbi:hypothetical protein STEG23_017303 [Scotinomys teguina]
MHRFKPDKTEEKRENEHEICPVFLCPFLHLIAAYGPSSSVESSGHLQIKDICLITVEHFNTIKLKQATSLFLIVAWNSSK